MHARAKASDFFVAGGTMPPASSSYVKRPADDELFDAALASEFCYVLTPRQMGKSSLMIRTARRLQAQGARTAIIDLTTMGTIAAETWYLDLLTELADELDLSTDAEAWWHTHASLGPVRRFVNFLRDVVLTEITEQVVIFIDEIDMTLNLDFSDDFFAAIRATYNTRAKDPAFNRLAFVLVGVATPSDLIQDQSRTPFNIGRAIDLQELSWTDAQMLQSGWSDVDSSQHTAILERIFYWTNGHPYLTQKLCLTVAEEEDEEMPWTDERVDDLVERLFLSEEARREANLKFVQDKILADSQSRQLLALYRRVYKNKTVDADERSLTQNQLKLSGLLKAENGCLRVRNEIYRRAFDLVWVKEHTPINWPPIVASVAIFVALLAIGFTYYNSIACTFFPQERWCPQSGQNLTGKDIFALASCDNGTLFAAAEDGVYSRAPNVTEWTREYQTNRDVRGLATSSDCSLVYAAAPDYGVLRRKQDALWEVVPSPTDMSQPVAVALSGNTILVGGEFGVRYSVIGKDHNWITTTVIGNVVNLAHSDGQIYASAWGDGVWHCDKENFGQWLEVKEIPDQALVLQAAGPLISGVPQLIGMNDGFYYWDSIEWKRDFERWGDTRTFGFAIDDATVYVGQENNGVLRGIDGDWKWEQMNTGWRTPPYRVRALLIRVDENAQRWLYAATNEGVWRYLLPKPLVAPTVPTPTPVTPTPSLTIPTPSHPPPTLTNTRPSMTFTPTFTPTAPMPTPTISTTMPTNTHTPTHTPTPQPTIPPAANVVLIGPEDRAEFDPNQQVDFYWTGPEPEQGDYYEVRVDGVSIGAAWFNADLQRWQSTWEARGRGGHTWQVFLMASDQQTVQGGPSPMRSFIIVSSNAAPTSLPTAPPVP